MTGNTDIDRALTDAGNWLLSNRDKKAGGWAAIKGRSPSSLNTAEALLAIHQVQDWLPPVGGQVKSAAEFVKQQQTKEGPDAGAWFRYLDGKPRCPDLARTSLAVEALIALSGTEPPPAVALGVRWLLSVRNSDGGWGYRSDVSSEVLPTCFAVSALLSVAAAEAEDCDSVIEKGLEFLVSRQRANGSFGAEDPLSGVRTAYAALCLQRGERCRLRADRDARDHAIAWLEANPVPALREVEETMEIDPDRDDPRADYTFLFMSEALVVRLLSESPDRQVRTGQLAREAMEALYKAMASDGGFFGQRVYSWSTARAAYALAAARRNFHTFPEAGRPTEPRKVGQVILFFLVLVLLSVVLLSLIGGFGAAQASVFALLVLAALVGYGVISETGFVQALRSVFSGGRGTP
ncbi:MAG TPA: prenyltransferase/squalene oxidase repeat-containing protein [Solirubrobacterales bacterium]